MLALLRRRRWRAGSVLLAIDVVILCAALLLLPADRVFWSVICAVAMNLTLALNHRSDRYVVH